MQLLLDCVKAFHDKMGVSAQCQMPADLSQGLDQRAHQILEVADDLQAAIGTDPRALRLHLIFEEAGELGVAMASGDEVATLDALADLLYVLLGTAVTFDLPLAEAFAEVHVSNMTKAKQPTDPHAERFRDKGPNYKAPDLKAVLETYRKQPRDDQRPNLFTTLQAAVGRFITRKD